jgi:hypothetical protein
MIAQLKIFANFLTIKYINTTFLSEPLYTGELNIYK